MAKARQLAASQINRLITHKPYVDNTNNIIYNLLFGDTPNLFKALIKPPITYPFDVLFSETSSESDLQKIIDDKDEDTRSVLDAYNKLLLRGIKSIKKELLGVIVEVSMEEGLDVMASFRDGSARLINHAEHIVIWETIIDKNANKITANLFKASQLILDKIGPWDKPRLPKPTTGNLRITFLVSDGLYFGEGPINLMFSDELAGPALAKMTELMEYITMASVQYKK